MKEPEEFGSTIEGASRRRAKNSLFAGAPFSPWGGHSRGVSLGHRVFARWEGLSAVQSDLLGPPDPASAPAGGAQLLVKVGRVDGSLRDDLVPLTSEFPVAWSRQGDRLEIRGRYSLATVVIRPTGEGLAEIRTVSDDRREFAESVTNFCRIVLAACYSSSGTHLLHSSAYSYRSGQTALVFGPSGAGKSTVGSIALGAGFEVLSDDLNVVDSRDASGVFVRAFPWSGTYGPRHWHGIPSYRLSGIFRLEQADRHEVEKLGAAQAVAGLAACSPFVNAEPGRYEELLDSLRGLVSRVPAFTLRFRKDPGFLDLVEKALR